MKKQLLFFALFLIAATQLSYAQCQRFGMLDAVDDPTNYPVSGTANITFLTDGTKEVQFQNDFSTVQGLQLEVFLTTTPRLGQGGTELQISTQPLQDDNGGMDLGDPITGMKTYTLPASVNLDDFSYVLIHCTLADVLWGRAQFGGASGADCSSLLSTEENRFQQITMLSDTDNNRAVFLNPSGKDLQVKLYNVIGQVVSEIPKTNEKNPILELSSQKAGIYIAVIESEGKQNIKKLVKK